MNYRFEIKIYGVESRMDMINSTARKLNIDKNNIFLDDRPNGGNPLYTAKKAYLSKFNKETTHGIFLQDDIEVCDDFINICTQIINSHPDKIISLFPYDYQDNTYELDNLIHTPYVPAYTLSACGIIMPVKYIKSCFDWIQCVYMDNITDDSGIQHWALSKNIETITTIPSIIQHIGDKSIINPNDRIRRTVYYKQNPIANWSSTEIYYVKIVDLIFAPKCKNIIRLGGILNGN